MQIEYCDFLTYYDIIFMSIVGYLSCNEGGLI